MCVRVCTRVHACAPKSMVGRKEEKRKRGREGKRGRGGEGERERGRGGEKERRGGERETDRDRLTHAHHLDLPVSSFNSYVPDYELLGQFYKIKTECSFLSHLASDKGESESGRH